MKVCIHDGLLVAVLTRNEHCPPHVHVGTADWEARFEFGFWHNDVSLLDVVPVKNQPSAAVLEALRQVIKTPQHLRRARECWWEVLGSTCLENQMWDAKEQEVVSPKAKRQGTRVIKAAVFDGRQYKTVLTLAGLDKPVEIKL